MKHSYSSEFLMSQCPVTEVPLMNLCSEERTFRYLPFFEKVAAQEPSLLEGCAPLGRRLRLLVEAILSTTGVIPGVLQWVTKALFRCPLKLLSLKGTGYRR